MNRIKVLDADVCNVAPYRHYLFLYDPYVLLEEITQIPIWYERRAGNISIPHAGVHVSFDLTYVHQIDISAYKNKKIRMVGKRWMRIIPSTAAQNSSYGLATEKDQKKGGGQKQKPAKPEQPDRDDKGSQRVKRPKKKNRH